MEDQQEESCYLLNGKEHPWEEVMDNKGNNGDNPNKEDGDSLHNNGEDNKEDGVNHPSKEVGVNHLSKDGEDNRAVGDSSHLSKEDGADSKEDGDSHLNKEDGEATTTVIKADGEKMIKY